MISSKHSRTYFDDDDDCDDAGRMESVHNYVAEDGAYPMQQEWTRKEVTMAIFQWIRIMRPKMIQMNLPAILLHRNPSVGKCYPCLSINHHLLCPWILSLSLLDTIPCPIQVPHQGTGLDSGASVSIEPMWLAAVLHNIPRRPFSRNFPELWWPQWQMLKWKLCRNIIKMPYLIFDWKQ